VTIFQREWWKGERGEETCEVRKGETVPPVSHKDREGDRRSSPRLKGGGLNIDAPAFFTDLPRDGRIVREKDVRVCGDSMEEEVVQKSNYGRERGFNEAEPGRES